jgi:hypothetical protein
MKFTQTKVNLQYVINFFKCPFFQIFFFCYTSYVKWKGNLTSNVLLVFVELHLSSQHSCHQWCSNWFPFLHCRLFTQIPKSTITNIHSNNFILCVEYLIHSSFKIIHMKTTLKKLYRLFVFLIPWLKAFYFIST